MSHSLDLPSSINLRPDAPTTQRIRARSVTNGQVDDEANIVPVEPIASSSSTSSVTPLTTSGNASGNLTSVSIGSVGVGVGSGMGNGSGIPISTSLQYSLSTLSEESSTNDDGSETTTIITTPPLSIPDLPPSKHLLPISISISSPSPSSSPLPSPLPLSSSPSSSVSQLSLSDPLSKPIPPLDPNALRTSLGILALVFASSLGIVLFLLSTLPALEIPHTVDQVFGIFTTLQSYRVSSSIAEIHVLFVLAVALTFKQAFSIPGSILMNLLLGALYGTWISTFYSCILTAVGSLCAYELARIFSPLVQYYLPTALSLTTRTLPSPSSSSFTSSLLLSRLFPLLPYSVLNLVSGVLRYPRGPFFWTIVVGSWPYNYVTCQVGEIMKDAGEGGIQGIWDAKLVIKLLTVSIISALPLVAKNQLQRAVTAIMSLVGGESGRIRLSSTSASSSSSRRSGWGRGSRREAERKRKEREVLGRGHVPRRSAVIVMNPSGSGFGSLEDGWGERGVHF